jgi:hypothetical protein
VTGELALVGEAGARRDLGQGEVTLRPQELPRASLMTAYAGGLRDVMLSPRLLAVLREYWATYRPTSSS